MELDYCPETFLNNRIFIQRRKLRVEGSKIVSDEWTYEESRQRMRGKRRTWSAGESVKDRGRERESCRRKSIGKKKNGRGKEDQ